MKKIFKKIIIFSIMFLSLFSISPLITQQPAYADDSDPEFGCRYFLGMVSWDCNVSNISSQDELKTNTWLIAANVLTDIGIIAAYLVVGYVIYGGYLYMFSSGDPTKVSSGKKTLTNAFIGLAAVILANVILTAIRFALLNGTHSFSEDCINNSCIDDPSTLIVNAINWVIGISGAVAVIFVLIGGIGYITSSGDAQKLQKAKKTITYALIGLAIVALSEIIVIFVSNIINDANSKATSANQTLIAKEYHEN